VRIQQGRGAFLGWIYSYAFGAITGLFAVRPFWRSLSEDCSRLRVFTS